MGSDCFNASLCHRITTSVYYVFGSVCNSNLINNYSCLKINKFISNQILIASLTRVTPWLEPNHSHSKEIVMTAINTNTAALNAQYYLAKSNKDMESSMAKLSSGQKVNSAADDAASLWLAV